MCDKKFAKIAYIPDKVKYDWFVACAQRISVRSIFVVKESYTCTQLGGLVCYLLLKQKIWPIK